MWHGLSSLCRLKRLRRLSSFPPVGFRRWRSRKSQREKIEEDEFGSFSKPSWDNFNISELQKATDNFNPDNIIGTGGYSEIYKGRLKDGQLIAVKKITKGTTDEQTLNLLCEMGILVHLHHPNIAKLIGVGVEGGMHLVLELSLHGSLENLLYDSQKKIDWDVRYRIAMGTAKGLEYLHEKCQRRIIHRDIKVANILLAEDFEVQQIKLPAEALKKGESMRICDFGLAKWLPDELPHHVVSNFEGTFGYLAPEYCTHGIVDEKTDVFAFGVLLLELISGRRAVDSSQTSIVVWAKQLQEQENIKELIDPSLNECYDSRQVNCAAKTAMRCIQHSPSLRPRMSQVLRILEDEVDNTKLPKTPYIRKAYSARAYEDEKEEVYSEAEYYSDMRKHKQIAYDL